MTRGGGAEKVLVMLKGGGGHNKFCGSFYAVAILEKKVYAVARASEYHARESEYHVPWGAFSLKNPCFRPMFIQENGKPL